MGRKRGSIEFTAVRSLPKPLGLAVGLCDLSATNNDMPWLLQHQSSPIAQGSKIGISTVLALIVNMVLVVCYLAALALFVVEDQRCRLLDARITVEKLVDSCWRQFGLLAGQPCYRQDL